MCGWRVRILPCGSDPPRMRDKCALADLWCWRFGTNSVYPRKKYYQVEFCLLGWLGPSPPNTIGTRAPWAQTNDGVQNDPHINAREIWSPTPRCRKAPSIPPCPAPLSLIPYFLWDCTLYVSCFLGHQIDATILLNEIHCLPPCSCCVWALRLFQHRPLFSMVRPSKAGSPRGVPKEGRGTFAGV